MHLTAKRDDLLDAINAVSRATATRTVQPILANTLLKTTDDGHLKLSATNMDLAIETVIPATVTKPVATTVSTRKLSEMISKLPSGADVSIKVDPKTGLAEVQSGASVFDIRTLPAEDYPTIEQIEQINTNTIEMPLSHLVRAIEQTAYAAASYDTNNVLGGVYLKLTDTQLEMAATDGSRLACCKEPVKATGVSGEGLSAIIPVKALAEWARMNPSGGGNGGDKNATVCIAIGGGKMGLRTEKMYLLTRLLDGQYPQYNQLIPAQNTITASVDRQSLIASLERTAVMANERTHVVKMTFDGTQLSLAANTPDLGDSKDTLSAACDAGDPLSIAFNYKFLLEALKVMDSEEVSMETNGALAPTVFKPGKDTGILGLVMPVQVK